MQRRRLEDRLRQALAFVETCGAARLLDIGCGSGRFALEAARRGVTVIGYDISEEAIARAKVLAERAGVQDRCLFECVDITAVEFPPADAWFDLGCLQYVERTEDVLQALSHVPGVFSCLPRRGHALNLLRYVYRTVLKGSAFRTFSESELRRLLAAWEPVDIEADGNRFWITRPCSDV
ncbi:MAG TPA: hypothetical protein DCP38_03740 [Acidobacteria bacterium]|nr:hypothetical protein [Acidobacteriota bacterium]